jgi:hypothetical protein
MDEAQPVELGRQAFELYLDASQPDPPGLEPTPGDGGRRDGRET